MLGNKKKGSLLKGYFTSIKKPSGLFTLANGVQSLIDALSNEPRGYLQLLYTP